MNIVFDWSGCFGLGDDEIIYREKIISAENFSRSWNEFGGDAL